MHPVYIYSADAFTFSRFVRTYNEFRITPQVLWQGEGVSRHTFSMIMVTYKIRAPLVSNELMTAGKTDTMIKRTNVHPVNCRKISKLSTLTRETIGAIKF